MGLSAGLQDVMELTPDRIAQAILVLALAAATTLSGVSSNEAATCRDLLQDERVACVGTLEQVADGYSDALDLARELCRD